MKKKLFQKKLVLRKELVSNLGQEEMTNLKAGDGCSEPPVWCPSQSCMPVVCDSVEVVCPW